VFVGSSATAFVVTGVLSTRRAPTRSTASRSGSRSAMSSRCPPPVSPLAKAALAASDVTVSIPMASGVDSLNVPTTALAVHALADCSMPENPATRAQPTR